MHVRYARTSPDWYGDYIALVEQMIVGSAAHRVCELGAGANPALSRTFIAEHGLDYVAVDVSADELAKAPEGYKTVHLDVAAPDFEPPGSFDLAFSVSVAEHIQAPEAFHRNVYALLRDDGRAMHHFSTLFGLPFLVNRLVPERISKHLLRGIAPTERDKQSRGKFPALYHWCRGPTTRQISRLEQTGFEVEEYVGLFGHFYYRSLPPAQRLEDWLAHWLTTHPHPALTSYAYVLLHKPSAQPREPGM